MKLTEFSLEESVSLEVAKSNATYNTTFYKLSAQILTYVGIHIYELSILKLLSKNLLP